jgi:hypothetical protein
MSDDELGHEARTFLEEAVRGEPGVGSEARARMRLRVLGGVAGGAAAGAALTSTGKGAAAATRAGEVTTSTISASFVTKGAIALLVVVAAAFGVTQALRNDAKLAIPVPVGVATTPAQRAPAETMPVEVVTMPAQPVPVPTSASPTPTAATGEPSSAPARNARSHAAFAEELALLERARRATAAGNQADALDALARMDRLPRSGAFAEEHDALRIVALCSSGRHEEGRAALTRFRAAFPRSLHTERVIAACRE